MATPVRRFCLMISQQKHQLLFAFFDLFCDPGLTEPDPQDHGCKNIAIPDWRRNRQVVVQQLVSFVEKQAIRAGAVAGNILHSGG